MKFSPGVLFAVGLVFAAGLAAGMLAPKKAAATPPADPPIAPLPDPVSNIETFYDPNGGEWALHPTATGFSGSTGAYGGKAAFAMSREVLIAEIRAYASVTNLDGTPKVPSYGKTPVLDHNGLPWIIDALGGSSFSGAYAGPPGANGAAGSISPSPYMDTYGEDTPVFTGSTLARVHDDIIEWSALRPLTV